MDNFPVSNSIAVLLFVRLFILQANDVANAAVTHAFVNQEDLTQTLTLFKYWLKTLEIVKLHFYGDIIGV